MLGQISFALVFNLSLYPIFFLEIDKVSLSYIYNKEQVANKARWET